MRGGAEGCVSTRHVVRVGLGFRDIWKNETDPMPDSYELVLCDISGAHKPVAVFRSERPFMPLHVGERFDDQGWDRLDGVGRIGSPDNPVRYLVFATKHLVFEVDGKVIYRFCVDLQPYSGPRSPAWGDHRPVG